MPNSFNSSSDVDRKLYKSILFSDIILIIDSAFTPHKMLQISSRNFGLGNKIIKNYNSQYQINTYFSPFFKPEKVSSKLREWELIMLDIISVSSLGNSSMISVKSHFLAMSRGVLFRISIFVYSNPSSNKYLVTAGWLLLTAQYKALKMIQLHNLIEMIAKLLLILSAPTMICRLLSH